MSGKDKYKAMISSTARDLPEHRGMMRDACLRLGFEPIMMEHLAAQDRSPSDVSLGMVKDADIYLGVFAFAYGSNPENDPRSYTEIEFDQAVALGIPVVSFFASEDVPWPPRLTDRGEKGEKIDRLKAKAAKDRVVQWFKSAEDLRGLVMHALGKFEKERGLNQSVTRKKSDAPSVTAYLHCLAEETRFLRMLGLGENLQPELEIKDAYVPLRTLVNRSIVDKRFGRYSKKHLEQTGPIEENIVLSGMFAVAARYKKRGVLLLGEPGAGKTTGARQLCWLLASGQNAPKDLGLPDGSVPVFLPLRKLQSGDLKKGLKEFVVRETRCENAPESQTNPGLELWNRTEPVLWVFDGLDEVVSEPVRVQACRKIQKFLSQRPDDYVLVTSRYQGYGSTLSLGGAFLQFHVQPLSTDQVEIFVDRWFRAVYEQLYGGKSGNVPDPGADAARLKAILNQPDYTIGGLRELRTNPLLLTVVCLVYHQEHSLPRGRAALYDKCVTVLLESWRKGVYEQQRSHAFDPRAAQRVLAHLAWWMHCQSESGLKDAAEGDRRGSPSAALAEMVKAIARPLAQTSPKAGLGRDPKRFLERMRDESGILVSASPGCCSFLHLTFQEYLAASDAVAEGCAADLANRAGQSWWREVILLALARGTGRFVQEFFVKLLSLPAWDADVGFAGRCLEEAAVTILDPFLAKLKSPKTSNPHKVRILQLLRQNDDPALAKVCQALVRHPDAGMAAAAREILERTRVASLSGAAALEESPDTVVAKLPAGGVHVASRSGIAFVLIPGGEFEMGSKKGGEDERPVHKVRVSPFLLGRYPVTNQEYERFLKETHGKSLPEFWNDKNFNQPQQPVVGVSWKDAQAFCKWAGCRLPTEAEWEYACRAGTKTEFCFGNALSSTQANFDGSEPYGRARKGPHLEKTSPVGSYEPNGLGLYDMHGNVWEWCQDWYGSDYYAQSPTNDPKGPDKGADRVLRGGCWCDSGEYCRSAYRNYARPSYRVSLIGFRAALSPRSVP